MRDLLLKIQSGQAEDSICIVNLAEIYYVLRRTSPKAVDGKMQNLRLYGLKFVPVEDTGLWRDAAKIKATHALSLGAAFAVATAQAYESTLVVGSDKEFNGINVELLRIRQ